MCITLDPFLFLAITAAENTAAILPGTSAKYPFGVPLCLVKLVGKILLRQLAGFVASQVCLRGRTRRFGALRGEKPLCFTYL
ncbi:hypothetical protein GYH30_031141 [Glycine max]|nr:hypothetical protein GYH30_031141 [Glycine max]